MNSKVYALWQENKSLLLFLILMMVFRSAVADWNDVPTGSMEPTIQVGDRLLINKMAYDIRIPFTTLSLGQLADPARGDIVIFESAVAEKRLVKRVIGLPGDRVAMKDNRLFINDQPMNYQLLHLQDGEALYRETLGSLSYTIKINTRHQYLDNFATVTVPQGHYLMLGDNRDNSADSRVIGFVPRAEIVGRSRQLAFSLDYNNYYLPRSQRFLHRL